MYYLELILRQIILIKKFKMIGVKNNVKVL